VTYETVRQWCLTFGQTYANELCRRRHGMGNMWHLDEVFLNVEKGLVNLQEGDVCLRGALPNVMDTPEICTLLRLSALQIIPI